MTKIKIFFDGGARPTNPGNGYGSYQIASEPINRTVSRREFGWMTNNMAEYQALIEALKWLIHHTEEMDTHLQIYSDSKLVVMQVQGSWKGKVAHLKELREEALHLLGCFNRWEIHWHGRANNVKRFGH